MLLSLLYISSLTLCAHAIDSLTLAFQWKQMNFEFSSIYARYDAINAKQFIPENNIPHGLDIYEDRIFITMPRWREGVAASLAYIYKNDTQDSPFLHPYPNWEAHKQNIPEPEIVSPFRIRVDSCGRLWILDSGHVNILLEDAKQYKPKLLIYDLKTDTLLKTYIIPEDQRDRQKSFFSNIAVEENECDDSFAYLADLGHPALIVYDFKADRSWMVEHHYFHDDPLAGNMTLANISYVWSDGINGLALSGKDPEGYSALYFNPLTSFNEFNVSTKVLRNESLATDSAANFRYFKVLGTRGPRTQSSASFIDKESGVLFYTLQNLNAVACWRTSRGNYTMESQGRIFLNDELLVFPNEVKVDQNHSLWVLSNKLPIFMYGRLYPNEYNFRILNTTVKEAIKGTACDSKMLFDNHIIRNITDARKTASSATRSEVYLLGVLFLSFMVAT